MKRLSARIALLLAVGMPTSLYCGATSLLAQAPTSQPGVTDDDDEIHLAPVPVGKGDESKRINMAARSGELPLVFVICPATTAATSSPHPILYWFISEDTRFRIDIAVIEPGNPATIYKKTFHQVKAGLHSVDLSNPPTTPPLEKGKNYKFTVQLTARENDVPRTTFCSGVITLAAPPVIAKQTPAGLAAAGLWCDAVDLLCKQIESDPTNAKLKARRDDLFRAESVFVIGDDAKPDHSHEDDMLKLLDKSPLGAGK